MTKNTFIKLHIPVRRESPNSRYSLRHKNFKNINLAI